MPRLTDEAAKLTPAQTAALLVAAEELLASIGITEPGESLTVTGELDGTDLRCLDNLYCAWNHCMRQIHGDPTAVMVPESNR